jgi:hypothetical protein
MGMAMQINSPNVPVTNISKLTPKRGVIRWRTTTATIKREIWPQIIIGMSMGLGVIAIKSFQRKTRSGISMGVINMGILMGIILAGNKIINKIPAECIKKISVSFFPSL